MKPSPISTAILLVPLLLAPAVLAQSPDSANQGAASPAPSASATGVPRLIKFSGMLLDAQDRPMAGPVGVTFALHAQQTGGAALWMETQNVTPDAHGNYTVLLGANSTNGVPAELFASGEARWLEVQVERQAEQPRVLLVSVPYALKAKDAETLGGKPASAFLTTETLAGNSAGTAAATSSSARLSAKAQTTPKKAASAPQPAVACTSVTSDGTATANSVAKFTAACAIQNSAITEAGGNVGIGTTAPIRALDIEGGTNTSVLVRGPGTHNVQLTGDSSSGRLGQDLNGFFFSSDTNGKAIKFLTDNGTLNEWMRITSAGNVGIGTTAPAAKLEIAGGNLALPNTSSGGTAGVVTFGGVPFMHNFGGTFVGRSAGNMSMTGGLNTVVGASALASNTTGTFNNAFGDGALFFNTDGGGNSAFGGHALYNNTIGAFNDAFGGDALASNTTGNYNDAFGFQALYQSTGNSNSAFGSSALRSTKGFANAAFGVSALYANINGSSNSAFGFFALDNNTVGSNNIALGANAGLNLRTGDNNIYIGNTGPIGGSESNIIRIGSTQTATFIAGTIMGNLNGNAATATNFTGHLAGEVTGTQNATVVSDAVVANTPSTIVRRDGSGSFAAGRIALSGNLSLPNTTSASAGVITLGGVPFLHNFGGNTFVGRSAGNMSMTGSSNTGVGFTALASNATGFYNSAFGEFALALNTAGNDNNAFGAGALEPNTTGSNNNAFGTSALSFNTTGSNNNAFGFSALDRNNTGTGNSAFGDSALLFNTSGSGNTAFGYFGLINLTSGDFNIAIGPNAGSGLKTGSKNIYIG